MRKRNLNLINSVKFFGVVCLLMLAASGKTFADTKDLYLQEGGFDIASGGTIQRIIAGTSGFTGTMRLKAAFHVDAGFHEFAQLRLELLKVKVNSSETRSVYTTSCYSIHAPSDKSPKCDAAITINNATADFPGTYVLKVTNNSGLRIKEFNIKKVGLNPLVPDFKSTFTENCPSSVNLDMEGSTFALDKDSSATRDLLGVSRKEGVIKLQAKWHTATLIPNVFVKLKVELLRPNGTVADSATSYSTHAPSDKQPSFRNSMHYEMTQADAGMTGTWRIRVTNNSNERIEGFNIEKGSDSNPFVRDFKSTYKANCN